MNNHLRETIFRRLQWVRGWIRYHPEASSVLAALFVQSLLLATVRFSPPVERFEDMTSVVQMIELSGPVNASTVREIPEEVSDEPDDKPVRKNFDPSPDTRPNEEDFKNFFSQHLVASLPKPVGSVLKPVYPSLARQQQIEGTVMILAFFDAVGTLRKFKVIRGIGYGCDEAAVEALRNQRFAPAVMDGKAVPVRMYVQYDFLLSD